MVVFDSNASEEVWYPIPRFSFYEISNRFRVRSWFLRGSRGRRAEIPAVVAVQTKRYPVVIGRRDDGVVAPIYLHRVVAELVYGPCPEGMQVLHRDDNKLNLSPSNLYHGTSKRNALDRIKNGRTRKAKGEDNSNAILSEDDVREIRRLKGLGWNPMVIGDKFGIAPRTVGDIVSGRRWPHVS